MWLSILSQNKLLKSAYTLVSNRLKNAIAQNILNFIGIIKTLKVRFPLLKTDLSIKFI